MILINAVSKRHKGNELIYLINNSNKKSHRPIHDQLPKFKYIKYFCHLFK